eukprot:TRINITY_DN10616_c0_g2_i9.p1 TRINITY_DN10616_c0_g2~~TRINITY_DN10616_c0_g2_i9.p1  ORF type:complete len:306 (-),score=79.02 TRINITY_DN10616_c0_g2_i9:224-1141(-)
MELISPEEAKRLCPILNIEGVYGAAFVPSDGYVDPTLLTQALATGARNYGTKIFEGIDVVGFRKKRFGRDERITHVIHSQGEVEIETVVNCAGLWARHCGLLMGVNVPTINVQHQYLVSEKIPDFPTNIPTLRDPDNLVYFKPEVDGLVMGGWEKNTIPVDVPLDFGPSLYTPNYDRFEQHIVGASKSVPILREVGVKTLINGPIPVSADGEPILGPSPNVVNAFVAAGFTAGVGASGGCGKALAEWVIEGSPPMDLWPLDLRRFGDCHASKKFLQERTVEVYGSYYSLHVPAKESKTARGVCKR